jgi:hypothetical protein
MNRGWGISKISILDKEKKQDRRICVVFVKLMYKGVKERHSETIYL